MYALTFLCSVFTCVLHFVSSQNKSYEGYKMFRLMPSSDQVPKVRMLQNMDGINMWSHYRSAYVDVMVSPNQHEKFQEFVRSGKIDSKLQIEDVQQLLDKEKRVQRKMGRRYHSGISFTHFHRINDINKYLEELCGKYNKTVMIKTIGKSTEGRELKVIKISENINTDYPAILIDGGIHAREWIAPSMALYIINQLLENTTNSNLLSSMEWHILPVVNPDGYEYSHTHDRMWRKTRSKISRQCYGVDANRNWDFHWNEVGTSADPCSEIYAGPTAFSEPETRALRDYGLSLKGRLKLYISFHSYGNVILHPWGYTKDPAEDDKEMKKLGMAANEANVKAGGEPYRVGSSSGIFYEAAGGSDDWMKAVAGAPFSYTVELTDPATGFLLPTKQIKPTVKKFFEGVRAFATKLKSMI